MNGMSLLTIAASVLCSACVASIVTKHTDRLYAAEQAPTRITAREFVVLDEAGRERVSLGVDRVLGARVALADETGEIRVALESRQTDSGDRVGILRIVGAESRNLMAIGQLNNDNTGLFMRTEGENAPLAVFQAFRDGSIRVILSGQQGAAVLSAGSEGGSSAQRATGLAIIDPGAGRLIEAGTGYAGAEGPSIRMFSDGEPIWAAP